MSGVIISLLLTCGIALQDPAALVEQLRSEEIDVRERAFAELLKLGAAAEPALKKVAGDRDAHVADSARRLLRILELDRTLSPALKAAMPGVVKRLALARGEEWTAAYLSFANEPPGGPGLGLSREELEPLAQEAIRGAVTSKAKREVLYAAVKWFHRSARASVVGLLKDPDKEVRYEARCALKDLLGSAAVPILIAELETDKALFVEAFAYAEEGCGARLEKFITDPDPEVSAPAIKYLARQKIRHAIPEVRAVLKSGPPDSKVAALDYLKAMKSKESIESIGPLLSDADSNVRKEAVKSLSEFGLKIDSKAWKRLLGDSDRYVIGEALSFMTSDDSRDLRPEVRKLARESRAETHWAALNALDRWKDPELAGILTESVRSVPTPEEKRQAVVMLGRCEPVQATESVRSLLADVKQSSDVRRAALSALTELKATPSQDQLLAIVRGSSDALAVDAALLLQPTAPDAIRPEILRIFQSSPLELLRTAGYGGIEDEEGSKIHPGCLGLLKLIEPSALAPLLLKFLQESETSGTRAVLVMADLGLVAAIPGLRALLDPKESRVTVAAAHALARLKAFEGRQDVVKLLRSGDEDVRLGAAEALYDLGVEGAVAELRRATHDSSQYVRRAAVDALLQHGVKEAIPDLLRVLDDPTDVYHRAARGLVELGSREHLPKMLEWAYSGDHDHHTVADEVLTVLRPPEAAPVVARMLDHRDADVRRRGIWLAQVLGLKRLSEKILESLAEPNLAPRAREALVELDARDLIPDLRDMAAGVDPVQRVNAIDALAGLEDRESASVIRRLLDHPDYDTRRSAVMAAGRLGDRESVPALIKSMRESPWQLRIHATIALEAIGGPAPVDALIALIQDPLLPYWHPVWDLIVRQRAVELVPDLRRRLKESKGDYSAEIARTLAGLGAKEAIPDLMKLVEHGNETWGAPAALATLRATEALPVLRRAVEKKREYGYERLAQAMADLGDLSAAENPQPGNLEEERGAAWILCARGDRRGVQAILKASENSPFSATVLNAIRNPAAWKALSDKRLRGEIAGTRIYVLGRLAAQVGLAIRWQKGASFEEMAWPYEWACGSNEWRSPTVLDAITDRITGNGEYECGWGNSIPPYSFILDPDSMRILPHREALEFWKQWWANEQGKKK